MTASVSWLGGLFILAVTILLPWAVVRNQDSALAMAWIPMRRRFVAMLVPQMVLGVAALIVAWFDSVEVFSSQTPPIGAWVSGVLFLVVAVLLVRPRWRQSMEEGKPTWRLFAPLTSVERAMWVFLSLTAGIAEELVWRGVLPVLLLRMTSSLGLAIGLSVVSFAVAHAVQGVRSVLAIGAFAIAFHALVYFSGSLYIAMTVHFIYDVIAGFTYASLARSLGLVEAPSRMEIATP